MRPAPLAAWRRLRFRRLTSRLAGRRLLRAFADAYPQAVFVEIGANDGEQHDHLRPLILSRAWSGVMVEPVPYVFERLRGNYGHLERVALENVAIAERDGRFPFYYPAPVEDTAREGLPDWYDGIGSFSRDEVLSHAREIPDIDERLMCTEVPCLSFESLCERHDIDHLDLLVVDTEGYDWEIIKTIDFSARAPRLVVYEHFHLRPAERDRCRAHLEDAGYETLAEHFDTFCLDARPEDDLTRCWRGLRAVLPPVSAHRDHE